MPPRPSKRPAREPPRRGKPSAAAGGRTTRKATTGRVRERRAPIAQVRREDLWGNPLTVGPKEKVWRLRIAGPELRELKRLSWRMGESFNLDGVINAYNGNGRLDLHSFDLDLLAGLTEEALEDRKAYPKETGARYEAMRALHERFRRLCADVFGDLIDQGPD